jgi:hypothetical protein
MLIKAKAYLFEGGNIKKKNLGPHILQGFMRYELSADTKISLNEPISETYKIKI